MPTKVCPDCDGDCTAPKGAPGVGGCDTCNGDGVVFVAQMELFDLDSERMNDEPN